MERTTRACAWTAAGDAAEYEKEYFEGDGKAQKDTTLGQNREFDLHIQVTDTLNGIKNGCSTS